MTEPGIIPMPLLVALARGGDLGDRLADTICKLVIDGAALGELQEADIGTAGEPRLVKVMPQIWLDRLNLAVERGAMARMSIERIVERLLLPPEVA